MSPSPSPDPTSTPSQQAQQGGSTHDQWQGARLLWSGLLCLAIIVGAIALERCS
ncbi:MULTISPECIES: hypothetical protein [unclassified Corallococcus]|uniref:hypothetical protein n=1 Tax=unclassified Corallococcus TaxID=2685029 RepID=UPI00131510A0|nr:MULTISPECIES: hypothetical protein [unclassified Corallococcus]